MLKRKLLNCIVFLSVIFLLSGCRKGKNIPNVSFVDGAFNMQRFEQDLWSLDSTITVPEVRALASKYPALWPLYITHVMPLGIAADASMSDTLASLNDLLGDPRLQFVVDTVETQYEEISDLTGEFEQAFKYYRYYFVDSQTPNLYTLISDFAYFPFIFEDADGRDGIGISLELFMGAEFPYTAVAGSDPMFSDYLVRTYNRDHLVKKTLDVLVDDIVGPQSGERLLDVMIHNGKKLYILQHLLPEQPDSVIFEFTPDQLAWCTNNERRIWAHLLTNDLLYSNDFNSFRKLVMYSPDVPGMPAEAPGRVANWTACQILHAAKRRNPYLQLTDVIAMKDPQEILELAHYRP